MLHHNLRPSAFMWLWAKYVRSFQEGKHCTHAILGPYSKILSGHNPRLEADRVLFFDEVPLRTYAAIYICGVARKGYARKQNYEHNLHCVIEPNTGVTDSFRFEDWTLRVENGRFVPVPSLEELPPRFKELPDSFTTCRIYRWAVVYRPAVRAEVPKRAR